MDGRRCGGLRHRCVLKWHTCTFSVAFLLCCASSPPPLLVSCACVLQVYYRQPKKTTTKNPIHHRSTEYTGVCNRFEEGTLLPSLLPIPSPLMDAKASSSSLRMWIVRVAGLAAGGALLLCLLRKGMPTCGDIFFKIYIFPFFCTRLLPLHSCSGTTPSALQRTATCVA